MVLSILSLILVGYFLYLIKKTNTRIDNISNSVNLQLDKNNLQLDKNKLYLLDELNRIKEENNNLIVSELHKLEKYNIKQINRKHEQLVSGEIQKLRSDLNKDLNDIVESVKNIKIF
jgi:formate dehydrogenase maturation protein FdhE